MDPLQLDLDACRLRQQRLIQVLQDHGLEQAVITTSTTIHWLTGGYFGTVATPAAMLRADGHLTLVAPAREGKPLPDGLAADEVIPYFWKLHSTMRDDQRAASSRALIAAVAANAEAAGVEFSTFPQHLRDHLSGPLTDLDTVIFSLRRRKDADEMRLLRRAIEINDAMYTHAREALHAGTNELELYGRMQAVATRELGEPLTYFGQDFQCNSRGGPPRNRQAQCGELYIFDLGVGVRGYYSDNARTFAVGRDPSDAQLQAWGRIVQVLEMVEERVRPGVSAKAVFEEAQQMLDDAQPFVFDHHLGHGVGLAPHEGPHLNPNWDDTFAVGDFFTAEPGLYHEDLRTGIRLEQNYLVTDDGVERLTHFPLDL
ncbi:MAG: aminopeptidase P family protein [Planctomycetales bacterium]|nr:aminopeptidase P family protein [Planctomycetales bacterium]